MADNAEQPKEELHVDSNEAERGAQQETSSSDQKPQNEGNSSDSTKKSHTPQSYGDAAGSKIDSTLGVVGHPVGKGLATVTAPLGNIVDSAVGGVTRAGEMAYSENGMGKEQDKLQKEDEEFSKPMGGKEQTGENPLGL